MSTGQRTEDRGQRIEERRQRIEERGQRTEDRGSGIHHFFYKEGGGLLSY